MQGPTVAPNYPADLKIKDSRKVNLRYSCLKIIDEMVRRMYSESVQVLMAKQGYSIEKKDIDLAKAETKKKLIERYLSGKSTKELTGVKSQLLNDLDLLDI